MELHEYILGKIRAGGGEHMLEADFQDGKLEILEDEYDLRGINLQNETINFPKTDNFNAVDLSYSEIWNSKFKNAYFYTSMSFVKLNDCTFERCTFVCNSAYGTIFDKVTFIDCDFLEGNSFTNCLFRNATFKNTFFSENVFYDCSFDSATSICDLPPLPINSTNSSVKIENYQKTEIYLSISEAYGSAGVFGLSRDYQFLYNKFLTRYSHSSLMNLIAGYTSELLAGYYLRPLRPLIALCIWFTVVFVLFCTQIDINKAFILSSGALLTFGAEANLLDSMSLFFKILYVMTSFIGISFTALFITVLANISIKSK